MKLLKLFLILFMLLIFKFNSNNLYAENDDILAANYFIANDTTELALLGSDEDGVITYLKKLSSSNFNGGGIFVQMDSSVVDSIFGTTDIDRAIIFKNAKTGKRWIRNEVLEAKPAKIEWWGAIGDGLTDDNEALVLALSSELPIQLESGKVYVSTNSITINNVHNISLSSTMNNVPGEIRFTGDTDGLILCNSSSVGSSSLIDTVVIGEHCAIVSDGSQFTEGDLIRFISNIDWISENRAEPTKKGELLSVKSVDNDTITFNEYFTDSYNPSVENVILTAFKPSNIYIDNIMITSKFNAEKTGLRIYNGLDCIISNCIVDSFQTCGIGIFVSMNTIIENNTIYNASKSNSGYGVQINSSRGTSVMNSKMVGCRRGVDVSGGSGWFPSRYSQILYNHVDGLNITQSYGFGSHSPAEFTTYSYNKIEGIRYAAFLIRGREEVISHNELLGAGNEDGESFYFAYMTSNAANVIVDNNVCLTGMMDKVDLENSLFSKSPKFFFSLGQLADATKNNYYTITNNRFFWKDNEQAFISLSQNCYNLTVKDNIIGYRTQSSPAFYFLNCPNVDTVTVENATIKDNVFNIHTGTFHFDLLNRVAFGDSCDISYDLNGVQTRYGGTKFGINGLQMDSVKTWNSDSVRFYYSGGKTVTLPFD